MLIHPTVERLRALGLTAMADAFIELQNAPDAGELSREALLPHDPFERPFRGLRLRRRCGRFGVALLLAPIFQLLECPK